MTTVRPTGRRAAVGLAVALVVVGASLAYGLYGPPNLARSGAASTPAAADAGRPETDLSLEETAQAGVVGSGQVRSGGFWAVKGSSLLVSTDGGQTWRGHSIPRPGLNALVGVPVFVLDADHAWSITDARTIYRTVDGGATWTAAALPGNCGINIGLSFVDERVGYSICLDGTARATVMRTDDGGATWVVAATNAATASGPIGSVMEATDERTLWAASNDFDNGTQALLAVSRDGGATWTDAGLPGVQAANVRAEDEGKAGWSAGLPAFVTPEDCLVGVGDRSNLSAGRRFFATEDVGRTWTALRTSGPNGAPTSVLTMDAWVSYEQSPPQILHTSDGGAHWTAVAAAGLPDPAYVYGFEFGDENHGTVEVISNAYDSGDLVLLETADGGATWTAPDLTSAAAAVAPSPPAGGDEAAVRVTVATYEGARLAGDQTAEDALLSPDSQIVPVDAPDATPSPSPTSFQIVGVARSGLQVDPTSGFENLAVLEEADYSRFYVVTVHEAFDRGPSADTRLLVAPLLGAGWRIWTPSSLPVSAK